MRLTATLELSRYAYAELMVRRLLKPGATVLDIGAGDAALMRQPIERAGLRWFGLDLRPQAPDVGYCDLNAPLQTFPAEPDLVLLLDVIEHLTNPGLALHHIRQAMPRDARLLVTTPNPRCSRSRLWALSTGFLMCFTQADLDGNGHVFPAWPHVLERMLCDSGFAIEEYVTLDGRTRWPKHPFSLRYPVRCAVAAAQLVIERRDPTACGMSYAVLARARG